MVLESEGAGGRTVRQAYSPADAVERLRGARPHWFAANVADGSGGGGGEPPADGSADPLPRVNSYQELLNNPDLLARYMEENRDEFDRIKGEHFAGPNGELGRILRGEGLDGRTKVLRGLKKLQDMQSGVQK